MITTNLLDRFLADVRGQAMREGTRYAREARVGDLVGSGASVSAVVRGLSDDYETVLWVEGERIAHRCSCPSWRDPCKHEVAAALVLKQCLARGDARPDENRLPSNRAEGANRGEQMQTTKQMKRTEPAKHEERWEQWEESEQGERAARPGSQSPPPDPEGTRHAALEERCVAARREKLQVRPGRPPFLEVRSPSGFAYLVQLRGGAGGPHSCDCPDFEANRLHTCKHTERVRRFLLTANGRLSSAHRAASARPRVYLHFGEVIEPRLFGRPTGRGAALVQESFDPEGIPLRPLSRDDSKLLGWLEGFGAWVEPEALVFLERRASRRPVLPRSPFERLLPSPLPLTPYAYQWEGARFLASSGRALLADEMGLGKTVQAILAAVALRRAAKPAEHVTIVCPASLRGGWQDEILRWIGEGVTLLEGPTIGRAATIASRPRWLITHYEQVLRDHKHHSAHPPDLLIVDEAQRAKGLKTRTARVLKAITAPYLFALTGTPLENRLEEAYAIAQLVDQRLLPPLWQIERDHFVRDGKGRRVVLYRNLDALRSNLAPAFLRRRKEDVALQLPDRVRSVMMLPMHPAVVDTYEEMMGAVARIAAKKVILPADLDRMMRLLVIARRCCNGPHMLGLEADDRAVPKLAELEDSLRDLCLGEGRKAVVFSEWTDMTDRAEALCTRLRLPSFHLNGDVPVKRRPALIRAFTDHSGPAVFISTDAGGVGLNLQTADVVISLDLPWNPAKLEQRIARVHRIGSRSTVQVLLLVCKGAVEERILELHDTKRRVLDNIWAKKGEDQIAAPGGSGAFRDMVKALLATAGPQPFEEETNQKSEDQSAVAVLAGSGAESGGTHLSGLGADEEALRTDGPGGAGVAGGAVGGSAGTLQSVPGGPPVAASAEPRPASITVAESVDRAPSVFPSIDPASLAAAVAAVAPTLPTEHRRSLSLVFRALAEALAAPGQ